MGSQFDLNLIADHQPLSRPAFAQPLDVDEYRMGYESFKCDHWDAERFKSFRLRFGVYSQRQAGLYMLRLKVPGGSLSLEQLDGVVAIAKHYGNEPFRLTTRQDIQLYSLDLDDIPEILAALQKIGITTREASGNTIRNITVCPLAGSCPHELVDAQQVADGLASSFLRDDLVQNMPRKVKVAVSGCSGDCAATFKDDLGFIATIKDGKQGFRVVAGGGLGSLPRLAVPLMDFVVEEELPRVVEAMARVHHKHSNRKVRSRSRIKFLLDGLGEEGFIQAFQDTFAQLGRLTPKQWQKLPWKNPKTAPDEPIINSGVVTEAKGTIALFVKVVGGEVSGEHMSQLLALVRSEGVENIRITSNQEILIRGLGHVAAKNIAQGVEAIGFVVRNNSLQQDDVLSCSGSTTCPLAISNSPALARQFRKSSFEDGRVIRISGCQNSCAQHHLADFGLHGVSRRLNGKNAPYYQITVGGKLNNGGELGRVGPLVPAFLAQKAVEVLRRAFINQKQDKNLGSWADRVGVAGMEELLNLETAVVSTHLTQPIDSSGITEQSLITKKVTSICSVTPAKPICYAMYAPPTAVSRLNSELSELNTEDTRYFYDLDDKNPFVLSSGAGGGGECAQPAVVAEHLADLAKVGISDLQRAIDVDDRKLAILYARSAILSGAKRLLEVTRIKTDSRDDSWVVEMVHSWNRNNPKMLATLDKVLALVEASTLGGDLNVLLKGIKRWNIIVSQAIDLKLLAQIPKEKSA
ncbi:MAG: nitrite/sulfite reductase [Magnetococcales bacterium]|nr:nitrite/sulfite reductase [Magnetococcales bacterium]